MNWGRIILGVLQLLQLFASLVSRKRIEEEVENRIELQTRKKQDEIRDSISDADVDSVSDDEIIRGG